MVLRKVRRAPRADAINTWTSMEPDPGSMYIVEILERAGRNNSFDILSSLDFIPSF